MSNVVQLRKQDDLIARIEDRLGKLEKGGGGNDNGGMDARVAKLEAAMNYVQRDIADIKTDLKEVRRDIASIRTTDFRILFGAIITVALGLAALMAKGFSWI